VVKIGATMEEDGHGASAVGRDVAPGLARSSRVRRQVQYPYGPDATGYLMYSADGYISYAGPYEDQGGKVVHHVKASLFPNWLGGDQERFYEVVGNRSSISTPWMLLAGREQRSYLIWERAVPEA